MWLRDYLPEDLEPKSLSARILTYGYDLKLPGSHSDAGIHDISQAFIRAVHAAKSHVRKPPAHI